MGFNMFNCRIEQQLRFEKIVSIRILNKRGSGDNRNNKSLSCSNKMLSISQNDVVKVRSDTSNTNVIVFISSKGNVICRSVVQATPGSPRSTMCQSIDGTFSGTRLKIIVRGIKVERN